MAALIKKKHVKVVEPRVNPISYNPPEEEFTGTVSSLCRKLYAQEITEWKRLMKPHVDPITHNPPEGEFVGAVSSLCWNLYAQGFDLKWLQKPDGCFDLVKNSNLVERTSESTNDGASG